MRERRATHRFQPIKTITVAVKSDEGLPARFGIVANISEGGVCVIMDVANYVGANVRLSLSFPNHRSPFSTSGKLCWIRKDAEGNIRYGVQFKPGPGTHTGERAIRDLRRLLQPASAQSLNASQA